MQPEAFLSLMEEIAPLSLAETWDNVGLLVEPERARPIERVLLTIDVTERVLDEAQAERVDAILAYHPPIFAGLKRLTSQSAAERVALRLVRAGVLVYSPHTALDAVPGGVNDWLAQAFDYSEIRPLRPSTIPTPTTGAFWPQDGRPRSSAGQGRWLRLRQPTPLGQVVDGVKRHLDLPGVRLSQASQVVHSVALCAGAGGSVLAGVAADLYLTGEMRHHDVLAARANGTNVVLTDHSHSERGYLSVLQAALQARAGKTLQVLRSRADAEPLTWT